MTRVLLLIQDANLRSRLRPLLAQQGCRVMSLAPTDADALDRVGTLSAIDLLIADWSAAPDDPGVQLVRDLRQHADRATALVLARDGSEDLAIQALRLKVDDYFKQPVSFDDLAAAIRRVCTARATATATSIEAALVGDTTIMRSLKSRITAIAASDNTVLITGETGTGKELVATQIHRASRRRRAPLVCIDCAALPENLVESELFGCERGAYTGAHAARIGKLELANSGTAFFDEIGDMSRFAQAKLLRAIETKEVCPLGGHRRVQLDLRVIAATNRDLAAMMRDDTFRHDLFFRLNVVRLVLPPLRERRSDIPLLVHHWLPALNTTFGRAVTAVNGNALRQLMSHEWPGNIRELKNVLEIAFLHLPPGETVVSELAAAVREVWQAAEMQPADERESLLSALATTHWNISAAARQLHWSRMTIYRRLAKYDLPVSRPVTVRPSSVTSSDSE